MDFKIEVEKSESKKDCSFGDFILYHKNCGRGIITEKIIHKSIEKGKPKINLMELFCNKCKGRIWVDIARVNFVGYTEQAVSKNQKLSIPGRLHASFGHDTIQIFRISDKKIISSIDLLVIPKAPSKKTLEKPKVDSEELHCPYCGGQIMLRNSYCPFCGAKLEERIKEMKKVSTHNK